ncbi:23S rRNA (uracil(1939)-C(5))-methyltransferase RlmD [Emcibacter nanhaiensis]|uniref:23S rRNA (Uracil(1939)-C(5))-methyltransferase RlmD n=1 Tax=Emcibacter nanhaiensis TaxID=1505037 RepID=A0A501PC01_9PROT|nr:23S rRNA (uracil(1939)-C(5))-methyltransferase RlmD [Emcibacter nanhaiensis]TPD57506.1 23S rRNA (uracil(1939)-C(5))-methyltransferase RlmD [Emcibacter nanhaiensis]
MKVEVQELGARGDGIAGPAGAEVYIPYSVPGDVLEVKLKGKQARISQVLEPSEHRQQPACRHFTRCGGCALQHVKADFYADWKRQQVMTALSHRGFEDVEILDPVTSPPGSRRRTRLNAIGRGKGKAILGFSEKGSHNLIDLQECPVLRPEIVALIPALRDFLGQVIELRQKMAVEITAADNGLDLLLESKGDPSLDLRMDVAAFAEARDIARISWRDTSLKRAAPEMLLERRQPIVTFAGRKILIPPGTFLQATREGEAALISRLLPHLKEGGKLVDIFAGVGTFSVPALKKMAVHALEGNAEMVEALQKSVNLAPLQHPFSAEVRDLFIRPFLAHELEGFDIAVIDPPRAGAREQVAELAASSVPVIVMVSCNPATFARDARTLADGGYHMGPVTPVDQFLWSSHLEVVSVFSRSSHF